MRAQSMRPPRQPIRDRFPKKSYPARPAEATLGMETHHLFYSFYF